MTTIFYLMSALVLFSALGVVFFKNPIYSVLSMVLCLFGIGIHYLMLNATFLAIVHIIVYAGAIMVLFLFVLMLLNLTPNNESKKNRLPIRVIAPTIAASLFLYVSVAILWNEPKLNTVFHSKVSGATKPIGLFLFKEYAIPFELSAVLFLIAMIGVVFLGRKEPYIIKDSYLEEQ